MANKKTSPEVASDAAKMLRDPTSTKTEETVAGSDLALGATKAEAQEGHVARRGTR
jgi:hypothetical protein